jgi:hypothetical protein
MRMTPREPSTAKNPDIITRDPAIVRNQHQILNRRLRDQHPVKRIRVMERQAPGGDRVHRQNRQRIEPQSPHDLIETLDWKNQTTGCRLDRYFPHAGTAEENLVFRRGNSLPNARTQSARRRDRPYENMRIKQKIQGDRPSNAA